MNIWAAKQGWGPHLSDILQISDRVLLEWPLHKSSYQSQRGGVADAVTVELKLAFWLARFLPAAFDRKSMIIILR